MVFQRLAQSWPLPSPLQVMKGKNDFVKPYFIYLLKHFGKHHWIGPGYIYANIHCKQYYDHFNIIYKVLPLGIS